MKALACAGHHHPDVPGPTRGIKMWVITAGTSDFPGKHVVREHVVGPRGVRSVETEPAAVVDTLDEARAAIPPGLAMLARDPDDDPVIVEAWL